MTRYKGINHLAMATGNMANTIRFWRDLLRMRLVVVGLGSPAIDITFPRSARTI